MKEPHLSTREKTSSSSCPHCTLLRTEHERLQAENERLLADWREQDAALQELYDMCGIDGMDSSPAVIAKSIRELIASERKECARLREVLQALQAIATEMSNPPMYQPEGGLGTPTVKARHIRQWSERLAEAVRTAVKEP